MEAHKLINQTSLKTEYITRPDILAAVRGMLGDIDLDVASCAAANELVVRAGRFFVEPDYITVDFPGAPGFPQVARRYRDWGGLSQAWYGRVWMNHPFGRPLSACQPGCARRTCRQRGWHSVKGQPGNSHWVTRLVNAHRHGRVTACCITFNCASEKWFRPLLDYPRWLPPERINYLTWDGEHFRETTGVTKGSVITYLGNDIDRFAACFAALGGRVDVPYRYYRCRVRGGGGANGPARTAIS